MGLTPGREDLARALDDAGGLRFVRATYLSGNKAVLTLDWQGRALQFTAAVVEVLDGELPERPKSRQRDESNPGIRACGDEDMQRVSARGEVITEYAHASNEDSRSWERGYATREAAIADGEVEYDGEGFVTGVVRPIKPEYFFRPKISDLLRDVANTAGDEMADMDGLEEEWTNKLHRVPTPQVDDLYLRLRTAFGDWCRAHDLDPQFFFVGYIEHHPGKEQE